MQEVNNGGFDQYFFKRASNYFSDALHGLVTIGVLLGGPLTKEADQIISGNETAPSDQDKCRDLLQESHSRKPNLDRDIGAVDNKFYTEIDTIMLCLQRYAEAQKLFARFSAS
ncbi:MAG: DUF4375 domain-containing protein [Alphaproteobacteria bacterium]|nr:DUF4375 domain-containing protein [Alphaproteobacteria bacterium]